MIYIRKGKGGEIGSGSGIYMIMRVNADIRMYN